MVLLPVLTFAQQQWGYGIAKVSAYSKNGKVHEQLFVSDPIELSQLVCAINASGNDEGDQVETYALYEECMKTWFSNKLQESGKVRDPEMHEVSGIVGQWPVSSLRTILRTDPSIDYTNFLNEYSFTSKERVQQQRLEFIAGVRRLHKKPVLIH